MAIGATPVWSMSLTAVRAYAAIRGVLTWSAIRRSMGMSGSPWLRARSSRSSRQARRLVSVTGTDAVASGAAGDCRTADCLGDDGPAGARGAPPQPAADIVTTATATATSSVFIGAGYPQARIRWGRTVTATRDSPGWSMSRGSAWYLAPTLSAKM